MAHKQPTKCNLCKKAPGQTTIEMRGDYLPVCRACAAKYRQEQMVLKQWHDRAKGAARE
jgi:ribosome-binding protein aMBF1 (putative translation factor)